jgi:hypothetical protein
VNRHQATLAASLLLATAAVTRAASADVEIQTQVSSRQIEVGEALTVQMTLMSSEEFKPGNPRLPAPAGISVQGPNVSTRTQMSISMNGQMVRQQGVTLSWTLVASKPGTYRIGPGSVDVNGQRQQGQPFNIEVLPPGSRSSAAPRGRGRGFPFPFDPFGGLSMPGFPFDDDQEEQEPRVPSAPPEYQLEHAPDPIAFLNARATPRKVVMGQAISLRIYAYGSQGAFGEISSNEPSREGFLAYDVDSGPRVTAVPVPIDGKVFIGAKLREMVLFPIRTGTLRIGPMRMGFQGRGYPATPGEPGLMRESAPVDITVVEPPLAGRPAGYRLGDVGRYTLAATVEPRNVKQGEAVSVIAKLEGTGNVPTKLVVPQQNGVDWPEPTVIEKLDAETGKVTGSRTFTFVVKLDRAGSVDLGDLTLPYYDADQQRYQVARASLGAVEVKADPAAAPVPSAGAPASPEDRLRGILTPRTQLGPAAEASSPLSERGTFFGFLLVGPFSVLAGAGIVRAGKRVRERWGTERATPARRALTELESARTHARTNDLPATSAAAERALHLALEGATRLKSRGVLRKELAPTLEARGLSHATAAEVVAVLEALELARFVQGQAEGEASALFARTETLVQSLARGKLG